MSKLIDERLPQKIGKGMLPDYPAIKSPWERQIGFLAATHYAARYSAVVSSAIMQAYRILVSDYAERATYLCEDAYARLLALMKGPYDGKVFFDLNNIHPFCRGGFVGALIGGRGDEGQLMCGRSNDFGTYRAEKELDICDWDIIGSELCRATTMSLQANGDGLADFLRPGPSFEFNMVEAKGCGDRHCRIVAESRDKYPMPPREIWQSFGPVATADQIKYTPEEKCVKESMMFREECNYIFTNGTNVENDASAVMVTYVCGATLYILPTIDYLIKKGIIDEKFAAHVLKCVCEAAGKSAFGDAAAKEGHRLWLGVPREIGDDDGRVLGGHIEMFLQSMTVAYEIESFNKNEVVYVIDRVKLCSGQPRFADCLVSYWYGMAKTLINAQWALWEEPADTPDSKLRVKIAKKIDKFC
ncbi:MAG: hypothetical protein LBS84_10195 [Clostridiales bacterium]|jgi:hypothetical protein|nr:hypothetical protein [Clostridiales bacterium]